MAEEIDEFKPIRESSAEAKEIFKRVVLLERDEMHRENPPLEDNVINIIRDVVK
jgi:hypothetical protein